MMNVAMEFQVLISLPVATFSPYPGLIYSNVLSSDDPSLAKMGIRKRRGDHGLKLKHISKQQN